mgnify:CR=1 FL=1|jgi:transcriptional regulator with XRE-family HTH domain
MKTVLNKTALEVLMKERGFDERSLAKEMGVAPSTVYRILKDERGVGGELIPKLLKAFDLSEKDFDKLFIFNEVLPYSNGKGVAK